MHERREVYYSGHVQGVGFRYTVAGIAKRFDVTGCVCNLADGRVELIAEGVPAELDGFVAAVADRMQGFIRDGQPARSPATGQFSDFSIRF
jgi:acylphosphatase